METAKNILLLLTFFITSLNFYFYFRFRKKDFQVAILNKQMAAYENLISNLFETNRIANEAYSKMISVENLLIDPEYLSKLPQLQIGAYMQFLPQYQKSFSQVQCELFLLPEDVIDETMNYYIHLTDLFGKNEDPELGLKLITEMNNKVYAVIDVIRHHIALDTMTEETRKLLSRKEQFRLVEN